MVSDGLHDDKPFSIFGPPQLRHLTGFEFNLQVFELTVPLEHEHFATPALIIQVPPVVVDKFFLQLQVPIFDDIHPI